MSDAKLAASSTNDKFDRNSTNRSTVSFNKLTKKIDKFSSHDFDLSDLHYQQLMNYKDKFDNRLFYKYRYNVEAAGKSKHEAVFESNNNIWSIPIGIVIFVILSTFSTFQILTGEKDSK